MCGWKEGGEGWEGGGEDAVFPPKRRCGGTAQAPAAGGWTPAAVCGGDSGPGCGWRRWVGGV
eukprot:364520-Chlamydomonas_euryale.AAC.10